MTYKVLRNNKETSYSKLEDVIKIISEVIDTKQTNMALNLLKKNKTVLIYSKEGNHITVQKGDLS